MRFAGNEDPLNGKYDIQKMFEAAKKEGAGRPDGRGGVTGLSLFGGEPLLVPTIDLERIFYLASSEKIPVSIQTNASLVTKSHIDLFEQYRVSIGVSLDGPEELNDLRAAKSDEATITTTAKSYMALRSMLQRKLSISLIATLYTTNVGDNQKLERFLKWIADLHARGLRSLNLHLLEVDDPSARQFVLPVERHIEVMRRLRTFCRAQPAFHVQPFAAMRALLLGQDEQNVDCIWHACDPYTTNAVRGIDGQGNRGNCGRTNKDGVPYVKGDAAGFERQLSLYLTPQEHGGCQGCRFFFACKGECPGTGEGEEWRSRTSHCKVLMALFEDIEQELIGEGQTPLSSSWQRATIESKLLEGWTRGQNFSIAAAIRGGSTGSIIEHGDAPHGDVPHGDHSDTVNPHRDHGDHYDSARVVPDPAGGTVQTGMRLPS